MKVTDFIVEFIISKGITDIFGYPGGVICHFMDSTTKYKKIVAHTNYHEQAAAFAACGYAQETGKMGVAYATSGPGATNLVTGIANAFFDSTPVLFLTGQVDTYGLKGELPIRQRGFQETDVVSIVKPITKYAVRVESPVMIKYELEKAYEIATTGNPGPVLLDLPADVQRSEVEPDSMQGYATPSVLDENIDSDSDAILKYINSAKRPCLIVGNGVKQAKSVNLLKEWIHRIEIPTVFSMPAFDTLPYDDEFNFGFLGANGHRYANFIVGKSDLVISIGSRLDLKQVGSNREQFAPNARIIRIDIDDNNFSYGVHEDDICVKADIHNLLTKLLERTSERTRICYSWIGVCNLIKKKLQGYDDEDYTLLLGRFCESLPDNVIATADVGQSEVWLAQQMHVKSQQTVHLSGGLGSMGYSLPAAIGAYYGGRKPVFCFNGDGGVQMNIQELQFLSRESIPIHVVIINNNSLGMIRGFQENNFYGNYFQTINGAGYSVPDFDKLAKAYGLTYCMISNEDDIKKLENMRIDSPSVIEIKISKETVLKPNFGKNALLLDQSPYIDRNLFEELMSL